MLPDDEMFCGGGGIGCVGAEGEEEEEAVVEDRHCGVKELEVSIERGCGRVARSQKEGRGCRRVCSDDNAFVWQPWCFGVVVVHS